MKFHVTSIPTLAGTRFYLTNGETRIPGGFASRAAAQAKADWLNHEDLTTKQILPHSPQDHLLRSERKPSTSIPKASKVEVHRTRNQTVSRRAY